MCTKTMFWLIVVLVNLAGVPAVCQDKTDVVKNDPELDKTEQNRLELTAHWAAFTDSKYEIGKRWETVKNLKPAEAKKSYSSDELAVFMPSVDVKQGEVWELDLENVVSFTRQFHSGATHRLHHGGPRGAYGCIAAENDSFRRIRTRAHVEFKLKDGVYLPSQFAGDIVIDRKTNKIIAFKLSVPPRRNNVDLNWEREPAEDERWSDGEGNIIPARKTIIADIGYCEKMELAGGDWTTVNDIKWTTELTFAEVDKMFQKRFYRAAQIDWLPWEDAVAKSRETGKPLHVVALFGVLDDESC